MVVSDHECRLGKWIDEQERNNMPFTKNSNWAHLKQVHHGVHNGMQEIINENASSSNNATLSSQAHKLDEAISDVFWTIQQVKRDNCKNQLNN